MKRLLATLLILPLSFISYAQVSKSSNPLYQYQNVKVKAKVMDMGTMLPLSDVTVYLIPQGDTTVTNFAISAGDGMVVMDKVVSGKYELYAEMLGYDTFSNVYDIYQAPGWDLDLGTIGMRENAESIDASSITAAGNPITIQNDTVIYHASSFRVGENAMLGDLLKRMPGISVSEDGTATVNGEKVDRITVGGRTFFFGDPSMAIRNLPAKIVEQIKVSHQESRSSQMGGISTEVVKETVMDVELKEEYQEGWFGDARIGSGATINDDKDNPLAQDTRYLYDGSVMTSVYGKKDQAVFIGNAYNIQTSDGSEVNITGLPQDDYTGLGGLMTSVQAGANYNTSRIRNFETTLSANYRHSTKEDRQRYSRTSFLSGGGDILTEGGSDAEGKEDQLMIDAELYKKTGSVLVDFAPRFYIRKGSMSSSDFSGLSSSFSASDNKQLLASGSFGITGTELGKKGRRIGFDLDYSAGSSDGNRFEKSVQSVDYDIAGKKLDLEGSLFYYEPFGEKWGIETSVGSSFNSSFSNRMAFDAGRIANDRLSNRTDRRFLQEGASVLMQYSNDTSTIKFGVNAAAYSDVMDARLLGVSTVVGKGDWKYRWSPVVMYSWSRDGHDLSFQYSNTTEPASSRQMIPTPDISDPRQTTIGNLYLKSGVSNSVMAYYNMVNYSTFTFLTVYANAEIKNNETVYASWFDNAGHRYAVPVNAKRPGSTANAYAILNQPLGKKKNFTLTLAAQVNMDSRTSYQAKTVQGEMNLDGFEYGAFMDELWGNESGDRFYSGASGFIDGRTNYLNSGFGVDMKYNKGIFSGTLSANASNGRSSYSLRQNASMNVWDYNVGGDILLQPEKGWELGTKMRYVYFSGYADGFGQPELRWDLSVGKTIKAFTLELKANDLLNQQRSLTRSVSSDYVEDSYRNVMGRTLLFSVSFNFGKLNSNKTSAVSKSIRKLGY